MNLVRASIGRAVLPAALALAIARLFGRGRHERSIADECLIADPGRRPHSRPGSD